MQRFLKALGALLGLAAALVGAYAGAAAVHLTGAFWIVVPASVLLALVWATAPRGVEYATRIRNYPKLLRTAGAAEKSLERLEAELAEARSAMGEKYSRGYWDAVGRMQGTLLAHESGATVRLDAVTVSDGLTVIGKIESGAVPEVGARFGVEAVATEEIKGVVEVVEHTDNNKLLMRLVSATMKDFWESLASRAVLDPAFPAGYRLVASNADHYPQNLQDGSDGIK